MHVRSEGGREDMLGAKKKCFGAKNGGSMPGMKAKMGVKGKAGRMLGLKEGGTNKRSH